MAIYDLFAEYGLCCVGEDGEGVDRIFFKFVIKYLLVLDMEFKFSNYFLSNDTEESLFRGLYIDDFVKMFLDRLSIKLFLVMVVVVEFGDKEVRDNIFF